MRKKPSKTVDVLNHFLVPKMHVLSNEQAEKMLKKYEVNTSQLPSIRSTDPAVRELKATVGNILAIERQDETGKYIAYRVVV